MATEQGFIEISCGERNDNGASFRFVTKRGWSMKCETIRLDLKIVDENVGYSEDVFNLGRSIENRLC